MTSNSVLRYLCPQIHSSLQHNQQTKESIQLSIQQTIEIKHDKNDDIDEKHEKHDTNVLHMGSFKPYQPIFSFQHFMIARSFSEISFVLCMVRCIFHPFILIYQTLIFCLVPFYTPKFSNNTDFSKLTICLYYDFLHLIVGRYPVKQNQEYQYEWFLSQTKHQKILRIFLTLIIISVDIYNSYVCVIFVYMNRLQNFSLLEMVGPPQLLIGLYVIYSIFIASSRKVFPKIPKIKRLETFYLLLDKDENCQNTMSVVNFYKKYFGKHMVNTDNNLELHITTRSVLISLFVSVIFASSPWFVREYNSGNRNSQLVESGEVWYGIIAAFINISIVFTITLSLGIKTFYGINTNFQEMQIVTHILKKDTSIIINNITLNKIKCGKKKRTTLPFLSLSPESNRISWLELRSAVYWKNKILIAESESIIVSLILFGLLSGFYTVWRLFSETVWEDALGSPSFVSILFVFILLWMIIIIMLVDAFAIQKLQKYQERFIEHQRAQIEFHLMTNIASNNDKTINTQTLLCYKEQFDILLKAVKDQDMSPKVYGITLNTALLKSFVALCISALYAMGQYIFNTKDYT